MISRLGILIKSTAMAACCAVSQAAQVTCSKHINSTSYHDDSNGVAAMGLDHDGNENFIQRLISVGFSENNFPSQTWAVMETEYWGYCPFQ